MIGYIVRFKIYIIKKSIIIEIYKNLILKHKIIFDDVKIYCLLNHILIRKTLKYCKN